MYTHTYIYIYILFVCVCVRVCVENNDVDPSKKNTRGYAWELRVDRAHNTTHTVVVILFLLSK